MIDPSQIPVRTVDGNGNEVDTTLDNVLFANWSNARVVTTLPATQWGVPLVEGIDNGNCRPFIAPSSLVRAADAPKYPDPISMQGKIPYVEESTGKLYHVTFEQIVAGVMTALAAKKQWTKLGTVAVSVTATIALGAQFGAQDKALSGVLAGEPLLTLPTSTVPAGWDIGSAVGTTAGNLKIRVFNPALAIGQSGTVNVDIYGLR